MNVKKSICDLSEVKNTGDISGAWVAESNYKYNIAPNVRDKNECIFQVMATLNVEFERGGSIEYNCEVIFVLQNFGEKPLLENLMRLAENSVEVLNDFFIQNQFFNPSDIVAQNLWMHYDRYNVADLIQKSLRDTYHEP